MAKNYVGTRGGRELRGGAGALVGTGSYLEAAHWNLAPSVERRTVRRLVLGLAMLIVGWVVLNFALEQAAVAVLSTPRQNGAWAAITRLDKLISALILFLLASDAGKRRLRWVAGGFLVLAFGQYSFNYLRPLLGDAYSLNAQTYENLFLYTFAYALLVVGLVSDTSPRLSWRWGLALLTLFGALAIVTVAYVDLLPQLVTVTVWETANTSGHAPLPGLTGWYFVLFTVPLILAIAAAVGTVRHNHGEKVGGWLTIAMVLLAGAQLHSLFWPLPHPSVMTSTRVLYFAVSTVVVLGGIMELRRIAEERRMLLAAEEERTRRLRELAALKADFTAMVAHELGSPVAAIQGYTDMLATGDLGPDHRARILERVEAETEALTSLIADVQAAAAVERDDFRVELRPTMLETLLSDASAYARTLPGNHPLATSTGTTGEWEERVLADPERIGQVMRNLLSNAAKYSPEGTPIELRAMPVEDPVAEATNGATGRVRIEVADRGWGIRPAELSHIFEKFGRGRDADKKAEGVGLGLYLSRRIAHAHGSELTVRSTPGEGSVFAFELEVVRDPHPAG